MTRSWALAVLAQLPPLSFVSINLSGRDPPGKSSPPSESSLKTHCEGWEGGEIGVKTPHLGQGLVGPCLWCLAVVQGLGPALRHAAWPSLIDLGPI